MQTGLIVQRKNKTDWPPKYQMWRIGGTSKTAHTEQGLKKYFQENGYVHFAKTNRYDDLEGLWVKTHEQPMVSRYEEDPDDSMAIREYMNRYARS